MPKFSKNKGYNIAPGEPCIAWGLIGIFESLIGIFEGLIDTHGLLIGNSGLFIGNPWR